MYLNAGFFLDDLESVVNFYTEFFLTSKGKLARTRFKVSINKYYSNFTIFKHLLMYRLQWSAFIAMPN